MKYYSITSVEDCPRCQSSATGLIKPYPDNIRENKRALKNGYYIRRVSPEEYRNYYKPCRVNAFCRDCGTEFRGETSVLELTQEECAEYAEETGIATELSYYIQSSHFINSLHRILKAAGKSLFR